MRKFDRRLIRASFANNKAAAAAAAATPRTDLILPAEPYRILPILLGAAGAFFRRAAIRGKKVEIHGRAVMGN